MRTILPAFQRHKEEGDIIGRLIAGYGELEIDLGLCVGWIIDDMDTALKAMFRASGEKQRVLIADALGRSKVPQGKQRTVFEQTIAGMHICRKIRNQYAHCNWLEQPGRLCFVNLEEVASLHGEIKLASLKQRHAEVGLLREQEGYFCYVSDCIRYLLFQAQLRLGEISTSPLPKAPPSRQPPKLHI